MFILLALLTGNWIQTLAAPINAVPQPHTPGSLQQNTNIRALDRASPAPIVANTANTYENSLELDGDGDYVEIADASELALSTVDGYTLEAWVAPTVITDCRTILSKDFQNAYYLGLCDGNIRYWTGGQQGTDGSTAVSRYAWTHIAVVWERDGTQTYYVNGKVDHSESAGPAPITNTEAVLIGANPAAPPNYEFNGNLAEVRIWGVARSQDDIRHTQHIALEEARPGLIAVWHLADDYRDSIGGYHGNPQGGADLSGYQAPPRPAVVPVDAYFNTLAFSLQHASTAYVPTHDLGLLIGGQRDGTISNQVDLVDLGSGEVNYASSLPTPLEQAMATYVPSQGTAYVFGGQDASGPSKHIYAVPLGLSSPYQISATLPTALYAGAAVYHPEHDKVYLFGGHDGTDRVSSILRFDPATKVITGPLTLALPEPLSDMAAAYSAATGNIYLFGGSDDIFLVDTVYEITLNNNGDVSSVNELYDTTLPDTSWRLRAVEDPISRLIYLVGGSNLNRVLIFDPVTQQLWESRLHLEEERRAPALFYSTVNRHAVLLGGSDGSSAQSSIWRIPLGDGPAMPLGHWDFPESVGGLVSAIDGTGDTVAVATNNDGLWVYNGDTTRDHYDSTDLVTDTLYAVRYNPLSNRIWVGSAEGGELIDRDTTSITTYINDAAYSTAFEPFGFEANADYAYFFGTANGLRWDVPDGDQNNFTGSLIGAIAHRDLGDLWVLSSSELKHLSYNAISGDSTETNYGAPCAGADLPGLYGYTSDMTLDHANNWWVTFWGSGESPHTGGICYYPAGDTPQNGNFFIPSFGDPYAGVSAQDVDVDSDNRVWVAVDAYESYAGSGGLVAYQVVTSANAAGTVRTEEFIWPYVPLDPEGYIAVGAADERVWAGDANGQLVTLAQRWWQLDESNAMGEKTIQHIWTVRGRAFFATNFDLYALMPDGKTWTHHPMTVNTMLGDSHGRIWAGTDTGVRHYTTMGWKTLENVEGDPPTRTVQALAEDQDGRIWIGSTEGLTLFDRDRFVLTFNSANSDLPNDEVQALLVDKDNRLWVGTDNGLARLDGSTWITWTTSDGLPANDVIDLAQLGNGDIAISTYETLSSQLSFFDGSTFTQREAPVSALTQLAGLSLSIDEQERLWAANALWSNYDWIGYYATNSGLRSDIIFDVATDKAERVWFAHGTLQQGISIRGTRLPPLAEVQPVITNVSPVTGTSGDIITIEGSGFGETPDRVRVTIGGARAEISSLRNDQIRARLNHQTRSGGIVVAVDGKSVSYAGDGGDIPPFCAIPQVHSFSPTGGNAGVPINIVGTNFDADATVTLGNGNPHESAPRQTTPTQLRVSITPTDTDGTLTVHNTCPDAEASATTDFRFYTPEIAEVVLNQGVRSLPSIANKPTMIQSYLTIDRALRPDDRLDVSFVRIRFHNSEGSHTYTAAYTRAVTSQVGEISDESLNDIDQSINVVVTPRIEDLLTPAGGTVGVEVSLWMRGHAVAQRTIQGLETLFLPDLTMRVLLVPIMTNNFTSTFPLRQNINPQLQNLEERIWPTGRVETYWSPAAFRVREVLAGNDDTQVNIASMLQLYHASHNLDRARHWWNEDNDPDTLVTLGVIDGGAVSPASGNTTGLGFWPNTSQILNQLALHHLDTLCDVGNAVLQVITLGAAGSDDGCHLEIPLYVAWATGNTNEASALFGHEMGHTMGLVDFASFNAGIALGPDANLTHSRNDEVDGGEGADACNGNATYDFDLSYYVQPGVEQPIINPLSGQVFQPRENDTATTGGCSATTGALVDRAKAMMSYAAADNNANTYFEPIDVVNIYHEMGMSSVRNFFHELRDFLPRNAESASVAPPFSTQVEAPTPRPIAGQRLRVSGIIDRQAITGSLEVVDMLGENAPLSPGFETGYWLVQLDEEDAELDRIGLFPVFRSFHSATIERNLGIFGTTVVLQENTQKLELRMDDQVLDTFTAGSTAPTVTVSSPAGGESYTSGPVPITWTATDADGDTLNIVVEYSADDGTTWTAVAFSTGSASVDVPLSQLAGSTQARVRVTANDGFQSGSATSAAFSVAAQAPLPYIGSPEPGATFLEGERIILRGNAEDNQDGKVADENLLWRSDRDGELGSGNERPVSLSVGQHTLTLEAENSAGLTNSVSISLTVLGDYDYDGVADEEELKARLSPLSEQDAYADNDGDGLPWITEYKRGTDPDDADSDDDGRDDGQEVADGTNPKANDPLPPPDHLRVAPEKLTFNADLSKDIPLPQQQIEILSRHAATWTLSADVGWLAASAITGTTPAGPTILVDAYELNDGTYTGTLTFQSVRLNDTLTVPVAVTITHSAGHFDANNDGGINIGDVQGVAGRIPMTNTQAGFSYRHDINRDGEISIVDATRLAQRWESDHVCCPISYTLSAANILYQVAGIPGINTTLTLSVQITDAQSLGGFEFATHFDPTVVQFRDASLGSFLGSTGRSVVTLSPITESTQTLVFGGYTHGSQNGASGDGALAQLTFDIVGSGDAHIQVQDVLLADPKGDVQQVEAASQKGTQGEKLYLPLIIKGASGH